MTFAARCVDEGCAETRSILGRILGDLATLEAENATLRADNARHLLTIQALQWPASVQYTPLPGDMAAK